MAILHPAAQGPLPKIAPLLIRALEDAGWSVRTTFWGGRRSDEALVEKVLVRSGELALALGRLLVRREAVLFVNSSHSWKGFVRDMPLLLAARCSGHGTVVLWHGSEPDRVARRPYSAVGLASALLVRCADTVLVLSQREMSFWGPTLSHGHFFRVVNPYAPRGVWPEKAPGVPPTILFVGRVIRAKGVFELLEAFAALSGVRDCRLVIAGDGPEAPAVRSWIDERGLGSRVVLKGYLDDAGLAQCYADADVFVLPSYSEGFPTVVSEAMDAGLPIVTTRCGGMADHLEEGVNGLFVRVGDAGELETALGHLLDHPAARAAMGAANRLRVKEFAPGKVVDGYVRALDFAAAAARRRSRSARRGSRGAPQGSRRAP
jgi:glycosyltransferase involved in cell wall biosynthesis